jgi:hypothetical protein
MKAKCPRGEAVNDAEAITDSKQSLIRRSLAVLSAALLAVAWAFGVSIPASAADKGSLQVVSITDQGSELGGSVLNLPPDVDIVGPVQNRPFNVAVRVLDNAGQPTTVNQATTIVLEEVSGPGVLGGTTSAVIPRTARVQPSRVRGTASSQTGLSFVSERHPE